MNALDLGVLHWPLAFQQPESPYGNILGWLVVFFMVVWPLIRGAIESANERRRKFIEQERRRGQAGGSSAGPRAGPAAPAGRPTLERDPFESLRRAMQQAREDQERQDQEREGNAPPPRQAPPAAPARPVEAKPQKSRVPRPHQAAPVHHERESRPVVRPETFGRDPFDDEQLERPLVADPDLARVPSEGGQATETPQRRRPPAATPPMDAPSPVIEPHIAIEPTMNPLSSRGRAVPVGGFALARIAQRVPSPWARAVLYEELLGPPVGLREPRI